MGSKERSKRRCLGRRRRKKYTGEDGAYGFDGVSAQSADVTGREVWHGVPSNHWTPKLFLMESTLPGLELKNSFAALDERDSDDEIPLLSVEDFPAISTETVFEQKSVPRVGNFKTETTKTTKGSALAVKQEVNGVQELYPLIRVEEHDDRPGLHAVSDSSRWKITCPLTGFTKVKGVLDSGATDSCAPDCMCPEVKSRKEAEEDKCTLQQEEGKSPTRERRTSQWSLEAIM